MTTALKGKGVKVADPAPEGTIRAAVYCRVSTEDQAREGTSLDTQAERGRAYCLAQGWAVAEVFTDGGVSGATALLDRPAGARLLAAVYGGEVERVVVLKVDRFARSLAEGAMTIRSMLEAGVGFVAVEESFDTSTEVGRLMLNLLLSFAEFERDRIAGRMATGRRATAEADKWPGRAAPFGYRVATEEERKETGYTLLIEEEEAETIRRIFTTTAGGASATATAEALNRDGVPTVSQRRGWRSAAPWSAHAVMAVLRSGYYLGGGVEQTIEGHAATSCPDRYRGGCAKCGGGETFTFAAPAIVAPEEWKAAHAGRKGRRVVEGRGQRRYAYALSERLHHDHDGEAPTMFGQKRPTDGGRAEARVYRCSAARKGADGSPASCPGLGVGPWGNGGKVTAVRADVVEARVLLWALDLLEDPDRLAGYLKAADASMVEAEGEVIDPAAIRARLDRLAEKRGRYLDQEADGLIDRATLRDRLARIDAEASALDAVLARAEEDAAARDSLRLSVEALLTMTVEGTGNPGEGIEPGHASPQSRSELRTLAGRVLADSTDTGPDRLTPEAVAEVARYGEALAVEVYLTANPARPMRPEVAVTFNPARVGLTRRESSAWRSACRAGCERVTRLRGGGRR